MRVRPRAEADVERLLAILQRTYDHDRYPRLLPDVPRDFVVSRHEVAAWVAETDVVIGQVAVLDLSGDDTLRAFTDEHGLTDDVVILGRLFVDPDARGSGAGGALLDAATTGTPRRLILDVMKDTEGPQRLYEKRGWQRIGEITREIRAHRFHEWVYLAPSPEN